MPLSARQAVTNLGLNKIYKVDRQPFRALLFSSEKWGEAARPFLTDWPWGHASWAGKHRSSATLGWPPQVSQCKGDTGSGVSCVQVPGRAVGQCVGLATRAVPREIPSQPEPPATARSPGPCHSAGGPVIPSADTHRTLLFLRSFNTQEYLLCPRHWQGTGRRQSREATQRTYMLEGDESRAEGIGRIGRSLQFN